MIKSLSPTHAQQCADLHQLCFDKNWSQSNFKDYLHNPAMMTLGFFSQDQLLGLLCLMVISSEAEIYTICTHPDHRHKHIASDLIIEMQIRAQECLITHIFLDVAVTNHAAIKCYSQNGFKKLSLRKDYFQIGTQKIDAQIMLWQSLS